MSVASQDKKENVATRLMRDFREVQRECQLQTVSAMPLDESNLLEWHVNLCPHDGPYAGHCVHAELTFPLDYPSQPPKVRLRTYIAHPNVFQEWGGGGGDERYWICLTMLKPPEHRLVPYEGWSSAYTVSSILIQLQSFLFDENIPQEGGYSKASFRDAYSISKTLEKLKAFKCDKCGHTHEKPYPPLKFRPVSRASESTPSPPPPPSPVQQQSQPTPAAPSRVEVKTESKRRGWNITWQTNAAVRSAPTTPTPPTVSSASISASTSASAPALSTPSRPVAAPPQTTPQAHPTAQAQPPRRVSQWVDRSTTLSKIAPSALPKKSTSQAPTPQTRPTVAQVQPVTPSSIRQVATPAPTSTRSRWSTISADLLGAVGSCLDHDDLKRAHNLCRYWRSVLRAQNLQLRRETVCFHTRLPFTECVMGVGISVEYHRNEAKQDASATVATAVDGKSSPSTPPQSPPPIKSCTATLDLLSDVAFYEQKVREGVWGESFTHHLPLALNTDHGRRARPLMEKVIAAVCLNKPLDQTERTEFQPTMVLEVVPTLMNCMVVSLMNAADVSQNIPTRHASEKALLGYCAFHHLLLLFNAWYPQLTVEAHRRIQQFANDPDFRHKKHTPDLGKMLPLLALTGASGLTWSSIAQPFFDEMLDRNVRWLLKEVPRLGTIPTLRQGEAVARDDDRLTTTFTNRITSFRLLMFQVHFLQTIACPPGSTPTQLLDAYNKALGQPPASLREALQRTCKDILAVKTWPAFYTRIHSICPDPAALTRKLCQAIENSLRKGYHWPYAPRQDGGGRGRGRGRGGRGGRFYR